MDFVGKILSAENGIFEPEISSSFCNKKKEETLSIANLRLYLFKNQSYPFCSVKKNSRMLLIGRCFLKDSCSELSDSEFDSYESLSKLEIVDKIWGHYVLFLFEDHSNQIEIAVSPSGGYSFYYAKDPSENIYFSSSTEYLIKILGKKQKLNWSYLANYISLGNLVTKETPFDGIYEVPYGCFLKVSEKKTHLGIFCHLEKMTNTPKASSTGLLEVFQRALSSWIRPYDTISVSFSGGLDSSFILYLLKSVIRDDQKLIALNYFHPRLGSAHELKHAREVVAHLGVELIEVNMSTCLPFDNYINSIKRLPDKPCPSLISQGLMEKLYDHLPLNSYTTMFTGQGGDHLFMSHPPKVGAVDAFVDKGFRFSFRVLQEIADHYRDSFLSLFIKNLGNLVSHKAQSFFNLNQTNLTFQKPNFLISNDFDIKLYKFIHPAFHRLKSNLPPGKRHQIVSFLAGCSDMFGGGVQRFENVHPFFWEPIAEKALSLPFYDLLKNGFDRYPLRKSLDEVFHSKIAWKREKGNSTGVFQLGLQKNLTRIVNLCVNGEYSRRGLVNENIVKQSIQSFASGDTIDIWHLLHLISAEIFIKQFRNEDLIS